jgi:hypothetical protein
VRASSAAAASRMSADIVERCRGASQTRVDSPSKIGCSHDVVRVVLSTKYIWPASVRRAFQPGGSKVAPDRNDGTRPGPALANDGRRFERGTDCAAAIMEDEGWQRA